MFVYKEIFEYSLTRKKKKKIIESAKPEKFIEIVFLYMKEFWMCENMHSSVEHYFYY